MTRTQIIVGLWLSACSIDAGEPSDDQKGWFDGDRTDVQGTWLGSNEQGFCLLDFEDRDFVRGPTRTEIYTLDFRCLPYEAESAVPLETWTRQRFARSDFNAHQMISQGVYREDDAFILRRPGDEDVRLAEFLAYHTPWKTDELLLEFAPSWAADGLTLIKLDRREAFKHRVATLLIERGMMSPLTLSGSNRFGDVEETCSLNISRVDREPSRIHINTDCGGETTSADLVPGAYPYPTSVSDVWFFEGHRVQDYDLHLAASNESQDLFTLSIGGSGFPFGRNSLRERSVAVRVATTRKDRRSIRIGREADTFRDGLELLRVGKHA